MALVLAQLAVLLDATFAGMTTDHEGHVSSHIFAEPVGLPSGSSVELLPLVYAVGFILMLVLGARLTDRVGRKKTLVIGLAGMTVATAYGATLALAPGTASIARVLEGAFAALVVSSAPVLVARSFPDGRERRVASGVSLLVTGTAPAIVLLAAWLVPLDLYWRACLFYEIPLALAALAAVALLVHDRPGRLGARPDPLGLILGAAGMIALIGCFPLYEGRFVLLPAAAGVLVAAFLLRQARTAGALLPPTGAPAGAPHWYALAAVLFSLGAVVQLTATGRLEW